MQLKSELIWLIPQGRGVAGFLVVGHEKLPGDITPGLESLMVQPETMGTSNIDSHIVASWVSQLLRYTMVYTIKHL
jgi:hypothetical protein